MRNSRKNGSDEPIRFNCFFSATFNNIFYEFLIEKDVIKIYLLCKQKEFCMNLKKLALALTLSASFGLMVACDDESSPAAPKENAEPASSASVTESSDAQGGEKINSSESKGNDIQSSESKAADPTSNESHSGVSSSSEEGSAATFGASCDQEGAKEMTSYMGVSLELVCQDGKWSIDKNLLACSDEGAIKDTTFSMNGISLPVKLVCEEGEWTYDADLNEVDNSCETEGATKDTSVTMNGKTYSAKMVCKDGEWIADQSCKEGETQEMELGGITMKLVCKDGEWAEDEEANACAPEGAKKNLEFNGLTMPMVCTGGEWVPDLDLGNF